jgi:aminomethyltransferase
VQGPRSAAILAPLTSINLAEVKYYASYPGQVAGRSVLLARTGYTGEDGFEIFAAPQDAEYLWAELGKAGAGDGLIPAGLAARDTLRLEAGMPLYGNELGADMTPFDAGLGRVVKLETPGGFVGRDALARRAQEAPVRQLVGLTVQSRRIPRHGYPVLYGGQPAGVVTSGAPSPTLGRPIAMAYVRPDIAAVATDPTRAGTADLAVDVRGNAEPATLVELPFYRRRS